MSREVEADYLINVELRDTAALLAWWYGENSLQLEVDGQ